MLRDVRSVGVEVEAHCDGRPIGNGLGICNVRTLTLASSTEWYMRLRKGEAESCTETATCSPLGASLHFLTSSSQLDYCRQEDWGLAAGLDHLMVIGDVTSHCACGPASLRSFTVQRWRQLFLLNVSLGPQDRSINVVVTK